jgi:hypothetical protein
MTITSSRGDLTVSRSVLALKAWHKLSVPDLAAAMRASKATAERRLANGGYSFVEVQHLAAYFGVTVDALETGRFDLTSSEIKRDYGCNRWLPLTDDGHPSQGVAA